MRRTDRKGDDMVDVAELGGHRAAGEAACQIQGEDMGRGTVGGLRLRAGNE